MEEWTHGYVYMCINSFKYILGVLEMKTSVDKNLPENYQIWISFSSFKFIQFISHHLNKKNENEDNFTKNKLIVFQIYYYYIYPEINWN